MRSEEHRHKISILWHSGHLEMYPHRSLIIALKKNQNSPLYSILKLTFPEIFKNKSFRFSQLSRNFVFLKFPFYGKLSLLICFSIDTRKPHSKIPKIAYLYSNLKLIFPEVLKIESFRFPQFSRNCV